MKLHLPKALLTAVLAVCVAQTVQATITDANKVYTVTGGDNKDGDNSIVLPEDEDYTLIFQITGTNTDNRNFFNETKTAKGTVIIGDESGTAARDDLGLIITNGNSGSGNNVEFSGKVVGNGIIKRVGDPPAAASSTENRITFSGDMTDYIGNIYIGANNTFTLTLGGKDTAVTAAKTTSTQGIAGTGKIEIATANSKLVFNYGKNENSTPVYITNTISEVNGVNGSTVTLKGGADYVFVKNVAVDNISIQASSLSLGAYSDTGDTGNITITGALGMQQGASINFTNGEHSIAKLDIHNGTGSTTTETLTISGATVKITGEDGDVTGTATGAAAVTVGHWHNGTGKIVVGGETASASLFDVSGATIRMSWDSGSVLEIKENGTVNAKRIQFANNDDNAVITLAGGRLNLGDGGVSANSNRNNGTKKRELNLNSGTLGALAGPVNIAAGTTNIGGAITIDTAIVDAAGNQKGGTADFIFSNNVVVLSDIAALTVKGGGSVTINSLNALKTLQCDVHDATELNVGSVSLSTIYGDLQLDAVSATYTDNIGGDLSENGFRTGEVVLRLFDGYEWNGSIEGYAVSTQNGDTLVTTNVNGSTFYVNEGTHKISTNSDYINGKAQGYSVAKDANLVIDGDSGSLTAAQILTGAIGSGNITVKKDITLSNGATSQATGKLTVQNAILNMGSDKGNNVAIESFNYITLDGGTINIRAASTEFKNVTITANGGALKVGDMQQDRSPHLLSGVTTIEKGGTFTLETTVWRQNTNIALLTGEGDLVIKDSYHSTNPNDDTVINISELKNFSGGITVDAGTDDVTRLNLTAGEAATLTGLTLNNGADMTLNGGNLTVGGNLKMSSASGITLDKDATINLGSTVSVKGVSSEEGAKSQIVRRVDTGDSPVKGDVYDTRNTEYSIKNAHVTVTSSSEINVSNKIDNSAITNNGTGTVNLVFGASDRTEVNALKGNINMMWMSDANGRTDILTKLEVADNLTIAAQVANVAIADITKENLSTLEVTKTAIFGSKATVKANLTLTNGASVTLNGYGETAATITGTLELGTGLELSGNVVKAIEEMQVDDKLLLLKADNVIFGDVDAAAFGEYADLSVAADAIVKATPLLESVVDAKAYFSTLNVENYKLLFENGALYIQYVNPIPEPTTATLSLLALAALASRRRRK